MNKQGGLMSENSMVIFTRASQMLQEANTIQKAKELKDLAHLSGVYAIFFKDKCIYIGQSKDIKKRFQGHDYSNWVELGAEILFFETKDRTNAEKILIKELNPPLNNKNSYYNFFAFREAQGLKNEGFVGSFLDRTAKPTKESMQDFFKGMEEHYAAS